MPELKIRDPVEEFVEDEYGDHGLEVMKKATEKMNRMMKWKDNHSEISKLMDGSFNISGASILKKYVNGPDSAWRMAIKRVKESVYAVEMFAKKSDEGEMVRELEKKF